MVKRTEDDARKDPQPGDEFQYSHAGLIYWRSIVRLTFDLRKRRVVNYHEQNIDNEDWYAECLLTSWRRWAKRIGVTVERVQQQEATMRTEDDARRDPQPGDVFSKRPRGQMRTVLPHNADNWVHPMVRYRIEDREWWGITYKKNFVKWAAGAEVLNVAQSEEGR